MQAEVADLVEEFLQSAKFNKALKVLKEERKDAKGKASHDPTAQVPIRLVAAAENHMRNQLLQVPLLDPTASLCVSQFLDAFDKGDRKKYFELWQQHLPASVRSVDPTGERPTHRLARTVRAASNRLLGDHGKNC